MHMKLKEEFEDLKIWYKYIEWMYMQKEKEFKDIGAKRDQGLVEILKLQKDLDDA